MLRDKARERYRNNPEPIKEYGRKYRETNTNHPRDNFRRLLKYHYGMTLEDYDNLICSQSGQCAVCGMQHRRLVVDHDHSTEGVRGLLCSNCNVGLGMLQDDPSLLRRAIDYLQNRD